MINPKVEVRSEVVVENERETRTAMETIAVVTTTKILYIPR